MTRRRLSLAVGVLRAVSAQPVPGPAERRSCPQRRQLPSVTQQGARAARRKGVVLNIHLFSAEWLSESEQGACACPSGYNCTWRSPSLTVRVTCPPSSLRRTPDRQSQSGPDVRSCRSDVSVFQSFAAKDISSASDFTVANHDL